MTAFLAVSLFFVLLPFAVLLTILFNRLVAEVRYHRRHGWQMDEATRDFVRWCYVILLVAQALGGW